MWGTISDTMKLCTFLLQLFYVLLYGSLTFFFWKVETKKQPNCRYEEVHAHCLPWQQTWIVHKRIAKAGSYVKLYLSRVAATCKYPTINYFPVEQLLYPTFMQCGRLLFYLNKIRYCSAPKQHILPCKARAVY
jgi:hypothetical protein